MTNQITSARGAAGRSFSGPGRYLAAAAFRRSLTCRSRVLLLCQDYVAVVWDFSSPLVIDVPGFGCFLVAS